MNLGERWSLAGMTALVSGGSRGIGQAIVEELVRFGAVVHTFSENQTELDQRLQEWKDMGLPVTGSVCDLTCREQRVKLMETVSSLFNGKLNILVNNAGIIIPKIATEVTEEDLSTTMTINFESGFHLCQMAHPMLKASGNGNIVFNSTISTAIAIPSASMYAASKGAVNQLTKNLACEWAKDNIRVNTVAPGLIKTPMVTLVMNDPRTVGPFEETLRRTALQRVGVTNEISAPIVFLCLPAASYITGQVLFVDGACVVNGFSTNHN